MKRLHLAALIALLTVAAALNDQAFAQTSPVLIGSLAGSPTGTCTTTAAPAGTWGIGTAAAGTPVTFNGVAQTNTGSVTLGACVNGVFWQMNSSQAWYLAGGTATAITWSGGTTTPPAGVTVPASPVTLAKGTATLNWIAPTTDSQGNPIPTVSGTQTNAITGFNVYQGTSITALTKIATTPAATLTYTATGLAAGSTFYFAITGVNVLGEGAKSNIVSGTMPAAPVTVLAVPTPAKSLTAK